MPSETIKNVPKKDVCKIVMRFIEAGATKVAVVKNDTGRWDITGSS